MRIEYENVLDDHLGKMHFTFVTTTDQLIPAHWLGDRWQDHCVDQ